MPYSSPASPTAVELPMHSNGRPGHRRSYSHIAFPTTPHSPSTYGEYSSTSSSLGSLPRRRSASTSGTLYAASVQQPTTTSNGTMNTTSTNMNDNTTTTFNANRKTTFQLGRDDDDDSSSDETLSPSIVRVTSPPPRPTSEGDDDGRALPPLRLKQKHLSSFAAPGSASVPFPRSSPPPPSPSSSYTALPFPQTAPLSPSQLSHRHPSHSHSQTHLPQPARQLRPSVSRTASSPVLLLSNGKPLKSSLKGSLSSSNIPFPSQSMVPSRMVQQDSAQLQLPNANGHQRAASAPSTPMTQPAAPLLKTAVSAPVLPDSSSEPSITSSASSSPSATPPPLSPLEDGSPSALHQHLALHFDHQDAHFPQHPYQHPHPHPYHHHTHQHHQPTKNVHFPSQEEGGLATIKIFNRSARPASLSRLGEETETETEGEGSSREAGYGGFGGWMGSFGLGKWGAKAGATSAATTAYPFPKVPVAAARAPGGSPLRRGQDEGAEEDEEEEVVKEEALDVDAANSSPVPARGAQRGEGNVYFESVGFVPGPAASSSTSATASQPLTLTGTLLVRNVTYQKTVAVRFTMDDWHTTNDVVAQYDKSLGGLPVRFVRGAAGELSAPSSPSNAPAGRVCNPAEVDGGVDCAGDVPPGTPPAWDRFRFEIRLEDYRTSIAGRVMWLVARYSAGVDGSDVGGPGGGAAAAGLGQGGEAMGGAGQEWWDNNAGCNYRIGFVKREVVVRRKRAEAGKKAAPAVAGYRRGVIVSAPPAYLPASRPTATSPAPKSYPAPPQISASSSFPGPSAQACSQQHQHLMQQQQHQQHQALVQSTMARLRKLNLRNYAAPAGYTGLGRDAASNTPTTTPTMEHGHRAPSMSSMTSVDSNSTTTSTDSTPLQTPTQADDDERDRAFEGKQDAAGVDIVHPGAEQEDADRTPTFRDALARPSWGVAADGELGMELGMTMENGFPATLDLRAPPASRSINIGGGGKVADVPGHVDLGVMGASPPFSAMSAEDVGASLTARTAPGGGASANNALYWPWGSFGDMASKSTAPAGGKENEQPVVALLPATPPPLSPPVALLLSDIQEKSTGVAAAPSGHISPPQRRRGVHHHHHHAAAAAQQQQQQTRFSVGGGSSSSSLSSSTGSASDSGSATPNGNHHHRHRSGASSSRSSPQSPVSSSIISSPTPKPLGAMVPAPSPRNGSPTMWGLRPGSPRPNASFGLGGGGGAGTRSPSGAGARSPLRLSPVNSNSALDSLGASAPGDGGGGGNNNSLPASPGGAGQDDAVYQAFVRQWCFAQAPGPTVGASVGAGGGTPTAVVATPRGEAQGPRLAVS